MATKEKMTVESLVKLRLHQVVMIETGVYVRRVVAGWLYTTYEGEEFSVVYVPLPEWVRNSVGNT